MAEKFCHSLPCKRSVRPLRGGHWNPRRHRDSQRGPDLLLCHLLLRRAPPPDPHSARDPISGPSPLSSQPMACAHSRAAREVNTQTQLRTTPERARRAVVRFRKPRRWPLAIGHNHYCFYPKSNQFSLESLAFWTARLCFSPAGWSSKVPLVFLMFCGEASLDLTGDVCHNM